MNLKFEIAWTIEKSSGQTTVLQKSMWSCTAEVWESFLTHFPVIGDIDKLDDIVGEYSNTYHRTIKMKPVDVKYNTYIDFEK